MRKLILVFEKLFELKICCFIIGNKITKIMKKHVIVFVHFNNLLVERFFSFFIKMLACPDGIKRKLSIILLEIEIFYFL